MTRGVRWITCANGHGVSSDFEVVRQSTIPPTLALRLAVGEAAEVLAVYRAAQVVTKEEMDIVAQAARMLRPRGDALHESGGYIGDSVDQMELIVAASQMGEKRELRLGVQTLNRLADALEEFGRDPSTYSDLASLIGDLERLHDVLAAANGIETDEVYFSSM